MKNRAAEIHASLKHPVIDGDGHWLEPVPVFLEYLREAGGAKSVDQVRALWQRNHAWYRATWEQRRHRSHAAQQLVGRHQQYPRQGNRPAAGLAEPTPARVGHRLRADLSEPWARPQRHRPG